MNRVVAVDWSGAKSGAASKIWLAEVRDHRLTRLESGRGRREIAEHLISEASANPNLVVGLDFAFSFPYWYVETLGPKCVEDLWELVAEEGEDWLLSCRPPFWGRPGKRKPDLSEYFRATEREASKSKGSNPQSVFKIGGAGAVGTGSIRGMPHLAILRKNGFSIWPFHKVKTPLLLEIYPRLLTGSVIKSDFDEREAYLAKYYPEIDDTFACKAASSEDAFDAAVSALVMSRHLDEIPTLVASRDDVYALEGKIWWPQEIREADPNAGHTTDRRLDCPFCDIRQASVVAKSRHAVAIEDQYPVSRGHTLVVPKIHAESLFGQNTDIQCDLWCLVARVRTELKSRFNPDGFNVGINDGRAAGQTVDHAHIHVIPRYNRDVRDPRGGVRWVVPEKAIYWDR